jgi:HTH-type transcriptional regulator/antitoxin HipB
MGGSWSQPIMVTVEKGGRRIDLVELLKLADILGMDIHALVDQLREIPDE